MANDVKRLNFIKYSLSSRPLLLINHLSISNKNYHVVLTVLKNEYLDEDGIFDKIFQDIHDFSIKLENYFGTLTEFISSGVVKIIRP